MEGLTLFEEWMGGWVGGSGGGKQEGWMKGELWLVCKINKRIKIKKTI